MSKGSYFVILNHNLGMQHGSIKLTLLHILSGTPIMHSHAQNTQQRVSPTDCHGLYECGAHWNFSL